TFLVSHGQVEKAIEHIETKLKAENTPKVTAQRLTADLYLYQFMVLAGKNDTEANRILRQVLEHNPLFMKRGKMVDHALKHQQSPDYELLAKLAEQSLQAEDYLSFLMVPAEKQIALKGDVLVEQGDTQKAIAAYTKDMEAARKQGNKTVIELCEKKLADIQLDNL